MKAKHKKKRTPARSTFMPREYGIGDFLSYVSGPNGLAAAAKKVAKEERAMKGPLASEKIN